MKPDVKYQGNPSHVRMPHTLYKSWFRNCFNFSETLSGVLTKFWLNWKFMQMQPLPIMELPIGKWWHRSNQIRYYFYKLHCIQIHSLNYSFLRRPRGTQLFSVILLTVLMPTTHTCSPATLPWTRVSWTTWSPRSKVPSLGNQWHSKTVEFAYHYYQILNYYSKTP